MGTPKVRNLIPRILPWAQEIISNIYNNSKSSDLHFPYSENAWSLSFVI